LSVWPGRACAGSTRTASTRAVRRARPTFSLCVDLLQPDRLKLVVLQRLDRGRSGPCVTSEAMSAGLKAVVQVTRPAALALEVHFTLPSPALTRSKHLIQRRQQADPDDGAQQFRVAGGADAELALPGPSPVAHLEPEQAGARRRPQGSAHPCQAVLVTSPTGPPRGRADLEGQIRLRTTWWM